MPPRDNPLDWLGQFVEVRQTEEPNLVLDTTNGYRAHRTYIDEMADQWRTRLEDQVRERIYEELTRPFTIENEPVTSTAEATFTVNNAFINDDLLRTLVGDWTVPQTIVKVDVEPEDVDPDEFEKILNGG